MNSPYSHPVYRKHRVRVMATHPLCQRCGTSPSTELNHILPLSLGGGHGIENLEALCHACHARETRKLRAVLRGGVRRRRYRSPRF